MKIEEVEEEPQSKDKELESAKKLLKSYIKARDEGIAAKNSELEALLDAMQQQQASSSGNMTLPKVGTDRAKNDTIVPKPFFVIKTATCKGEKIFINVCGSPKIPAPAEWEEGIPADVEEALKANNDSESLLGIPNIRFPVSCSDPINSTDHGGKSCRVFDMVYNSSIIELTISSKKMKLFLIEMATTWISQKYSLKLNSDFKLPNMKYKGGNVACQEIRVAPIGPLVSEIPCDSDLDPSFPLLLKPQGIKGQLSKTDVPTSSGHRKLPTAFATQTVAPSESKCLSLENSTNPSAALAMDKTTYNGETKLGDKQQFPPFDMPVKQPLIELGYSSRPVDAIIVIISFHERKLEDLEVFVTYTQLVIKTKSNQPLEVSIPFCTKLPTADASFDVSTGTLTMKLPFCPYSQALIQSPSSTIQDNGLLDHCLDRYDHMYSYGDRSI